ncbi:MAG: hypothetical protein ACFFC7_24760 [Candidatus Hermodarchaeota archaeon]
MCKRVFDYIVRIIKIIYCYFVHPKYEPQNWNDAGTTQLCNNCYNYACNIITNNYAQPGHASGNIYSSINCQEVAEGAISDGLLPVADEEKCKLCSHKVALVIDPDSPVDFHWYRLDKEGNWSHKPGQWSVTNLDNSGNIISDPRTADRGRYSVFCGFFCVPKGTVTISGFGCY